MRTHTNLAQFSVLRSFARQSVFTVRIDKWWEVLVEGKEIQPLVTIKMHLIYSQVL